MTQGPGNLGTGTKWGYSGVAAGEAVNAAAVLGGRPVASLRISFADPRERHQGVSHHSLTAYGQVALAAADVVIPALPEPRAARVAADVAPLGPRHRLVTVPVDGLEEALRATPVALSTMGRSLDEDLEYFLAAAAAGAARASAYSPGSGHQVSPSMLPAEPGRAGELSLAELGQAARMSTTKTRVSVPLMPAWEAPVEP